MIISELRFSIWSMHGYTRLIHPRFKHGKCVQLLKRTLLKTENVVDVDERHCIIHVTKIINYLSHLGHYLYREFTIIHGLPSLYKADSNTFKKWKHTLESIRFGMFIREIGWVLRIHKPYGNFMLKSRFFWKLIFGHKMRISVKL